MFFDNSQQLVFFCLLKLSLPFESLPGSFGAGARLHGGGLHPTPGDHRLDGLLCRRGSGEEGQSAEPCVGWDFSC